MSKNIILQGLPGVGKTTLIKKISNKLKDMAVIVTGFYTEELRDSRNHRIGFDIVTLENQRGKLARKSEATSSKDKVGAYDVYIDEFEKIAFPIFNDLKTVLIIDEIGKMELISKKFQNLVETVITNPQVKVIATIPLKGGGPTIQKIKSNTLNQIFTVTTENREKLLDEIISIIAK